MALHRCFPALDRGDGGRNLEPRGRARERNMTVEVVLASTSSSRRAMLEAAGLNFTTVAPNVDEDQVRSLLQDAGAYPQTIAEALAEAKALAVSERHPEAIVLGADQLLVCDDRIFTKALDEDEARETLRSL